ncbi:hypothetical protein AK812_SmicGene17486 [Symbiodinium microadriaticum]|uniref:Uncharacterized protein n=1 Tax=Symbiodinium microadriaticum TaxID=2951 RepID=A0A1Q9DXL0_SYMMI|nr:hypothetical protein AK812_SmicGene17486 [Symbiodinium microadriaticum]
MPGIRCRLLVFRSTEPQGAPGAAQGKVASKAPPGAAKEPPPRQARSAQSAQSQGSATEDLDAGQLRIGRRKKLPQQLPSERFTKRPEVRNWQAIRTLLLDRDNDHIWSVPKPHHDPRSQPRAELPLGEETPESEDEDLSNEGHDESAGEEEEALRDWLLARSSGSPGLVARLYRLVSQRLYFDDVTEFSALLVGVARVS